MKLSEARNAYYTHTGNASSVARQIAFAGIAVIWLFNTPAGDKPINLPSELVFVALLLVISMSLDLLQYVSASLVWGLFSRNQEIKNKHKLKSDPYCPANPLLNWPSLICFWLKIVFLIASYIYLGKFMLTKL